MIIPLTATVVAGMAALLVSAGLHAEASTRLPVIPPNVLSALVRRVLGVYVQRGR